MKHKKNGRDEQEPSTIIFYRRSRNTRENPFGAIEQINTMPYFQQPAYSRRNHSIATYNVMINFTYDPMTTENHCKFGEHEF